MKTLSAQNLFILLQVKIKQAAVFSTTPQKEHVSSISEYSESNELTG